LKKLLGLALIATLGIAAWKLFLDPGRPHDPKVFGSPAKTQWRPDGARVAGQHGYEIIPEPTTFHAIHVGVVNADDVWVAAAPMFELDWVAEPSYFIGNGPTFDNEGNLYFSPRFYHGERVAVVSLDAETGERRWAIPAEDDLEAMSPAFVLNDPENPGAQILYVVSYTRALALRPDGSVVWSTPTGLEFPPVVPGKNPSTGFLLSFNYHPATDSLITVSRAGELFAFDRATGEMAAPIGQLPGAPAISGTGVKIPGFVTGRVDPLMDAAFGRTEGGLGLFTSAVNYIYGGGGVVTNYFSIAPDSSRIYIAATADDAEDGTEDGQSEIGAIYVLDLADDGVGGLVFEILGSATFQGGTGSTPALSADGERVYISDNVGNVIALDSELGEIWRFEVGEPLVGSISVASDNAELYAVTRNDVIKLVDEGDAARREWTAKLDGFDGYANVDRQSNLLTATIAANGVVVGIGGGKTLFGANLMLHVGMGLLDRETGELRYFTEGREDSLAMSTVAPDGSIYVAHSPIRRAVGKAIYPDLTPELTGGVARYKPIRLDLLARDAICAAAARVANATDLDSVTDAAALDADLRQARVLLDQASGALARAVADGDMKVAETERVGDLVGQGLLGLTPGGLAASRKPLADACALFPDVEMPGTSVP
jgi:outer membrane protein assembly factor BamB